MKITKVFALILAIALIATIPMSSHTTNVPQILENNVLNITEGVQLNTFPVDLDLLYWADNLSMRNYYLDDIGNGSDAWMLSPYGLHFLSHMYGLDHWYCYTWLRPLEVRAPHDGTFGNWQIFNESVRHVNGTEVILDLHLWIDIGQDCSLILGHLCLLKSIYDHIQTYNTYTFTEGELIGYTRPSNGTVTPSMSPQCDFWYLRNGEPVCPYGYLNASIQAKITALFDLEYDRAKIAGTFPEAELCNPLVVDIEDSVWGCWTYKTGPFNSNIDTSDFYSVFNHGAGFITFLNRSYWTAETFYRDWRDPANKNLTADIVGIASDNYEGNNYSEYSIYGRSLVKQAEGDLTEGILEIITAQPYYDRPFNTSQFARYSVEPNGAGVEDDILTIEYFENLTAAQAGFTSAHITYERIYPFHEPDDEGIPSFLLAGVLFAIAVVLSLYKFKRTDLR
jgi:hypothetical protein